MKWFDFLCLDPATNEIFGAYIIGNTGYIHTDSLDIHL